MKKLILSSIILFSISLVFIACGSSSEKKETIEQTKEQKTEYICPMHPEVISDKPGKCPKCGMELIKKENKSKSSDTTKNKLYSV
ncbi:MAG: heavy metal-binding domain-containing protein [Bacteroidota bacterium]|nr:heavy metal-binding domain-containing protein [Bacteroidota bacterium]